MIDGWFERIKKLNISSRGYFSILGFKIAAIAGFFMAVTVIACLALHESSGEGFTEVYKVAGSPVFWAAMLLCFLALMAVLSKVFILPLRDLVRHIGALEEGRDVEPFLIRSKDELGYLTHRFESLHRVVRQEIDSRDRQLSAQHDFTNSAAGVFDIPTLMDNFFNTLRSTVAFDIGAYVLSHRDMTAGRIYTTVEMPGGRGAAEIKERLLSRVSNYCHDFPKEKVGRLEATRIHYGAGAWAPVPESAPTHFIDLPLVCFGTPIGIVSLISYSSAGTDPALTARVFTAMVSHTGSVLERLLNHISAEERRLTNILASMHEGVYIIDSDGRPISINRKGMELAASFSSVAAQSRTCANLQPSPAVAWETSEFSGVLNKVRRLSPGLDGKAYTEELRSADGVSVLLSISDLVNENNGKEGYVVSARDVTEDRLIQKRVMLSSKLAALGEMAAGIAHEVNNPLQVMMANIELLEESVDERGARRIDNLKDGVFRIKGIIRDLLIFAREQTTEVEDVDVNVVVEKVVSILRNQLKVANIRIDLDLDRRSLVVKCNKNLFQQVIINLLQNAKDAIEESKKGTGVRISTRQLPGGNAVVEVADDGPGIPDKIVDRVFDPFFTTKDAGKGTGLGLSVSRRIIEGMGGSIAVASTPEGTTFTINLLYRRAPLLKDPSVRTGSDYSALATKTVLIVDDEDGVLRAVKETLGEKFSSIDCFADGEAALEKTLDRDYDFILLDIKMPGMNGMELYGRLSEAKPYLADRVIFLTGDTENETTEAFIKLTGCRCLSKPFELRELLDIMSEYYAGVTLERCKG